MFHRYENVDNISIANENGKLVLTFHQEETPVEQERRVKFDREDEHGMMVAGWRKYRVADVPTERLSAALFARGRGAKWGGEDIADELHRRALDR